MTNMKRSHLGPDIPSYVHHSSQFTAAHSEAQLSMLWNGQRNEERNSKLQRKGHTETQKNKGVNGKIQVLLLLKLMLKWWISVGGQLGTSEEIKL